MLAIFNLQNILRMKKIVCVFILLVVSSYLFAQYKVEPKMKWWYENRFGMFIHFGSYSQMERGEWAFSIESWSKWPYQQQCSAKFNPTSFSAKDIVGLAKKAGMRYLVITAKHHEGFAMWDTKVASFTDSVGAKIYSLPSYTPFKRDILMELKQECARQGIKFGLYYSILDWNHKSQRLSRGKDIFSRMNSMDERSSYIADMKLQLKELLVRYDPAILWFDGDWCPNPASPTLDDWWTSADGKDLYSFLVKQKPSLIVNERVKRGCGLGDFECPEQVVPEKPLSRLWETCATLNGGWGYDAPRENSYKSSKELVEELVKVVSRDGNYLLNIGPRADGSVAPKTSLLLSEIGSWMSACSGAIYGATRSPFSQSFDWGYCTKKNGILYCCIFRNPKSGMLILPKLRNSIKEVYVLGDPSKKVKFSLSEKGIAMQLAPNISSSGVCTVLVVKVSGIPQAL